MAMNNKQRWMGGVVLMGGGALLAALLLKGHGQEALIPSAIQQQNNPSQTISSNRSNDVSPAEGDDFSPIHLQPLAIDVETEQRLLQEQRKQREKSVAEQEARTSEFLARQQQAEANAARKAAEEYAAQLANRKARLDSQLQSSDSIAPELIDDDVQRKTKEQRQEIERLAAQANVRADEAKQVSLDAEKAALAARDRAEQARQEKEALKRAQAEKLEKERKQVEAKKKEQQLAAKKKAEAEAKKKEQELAAQQKAEAQAKKEAEAQKKAEELAAKKKAAAQAKKDKEVADKLKAEAEEKQKEYELAVKKKAEADAKRKEAELAIKRKAELQAKKEAEARKNEKESSIDLVASKKKLEEERGRAILEGDTKPWMVQIAIASNQANADNLVADLRAKGYQVKTSQTSKGVRVMLGPEKGRAAADALRNQVAKDPSIKAKNAWVIDWQPPE